jgi:Rhodopirellula transposase DDE domain
MEITDALKTFFTETVETLKGSNRRLFIARTVVLLGRGGASRAERELGWNRSTIRKGQHELVSGLRCLDAYAGRGRSRVEAHLPNLLDDLRALVDRQSQTDPSFKTTRLYTRLSAAEIRQQLITQKGYTEAELPTRRTLSTKLNALGYHLRRVAKSKPKKKLPETDAIFERVHQINAAADQADEVLRLSLDAKALVKIGEFSRGGVSRVAVAAADHDFKPKATLTPFGFLLPKYDDLFLYCSTSKVTSDFIVDCLTALWQTVLRPRFPQVKMLVLNQDNGPENHSRRTQFLKRIVEFALEQQLCIRLAYYPPYHSKYNPVERCFGVLENHWNGAILDEVETAVQFAESMTWKGKHPIVKLVTTVYQTGVRLTHAAMKELEKRVRRLPKLGKWFVDIVPPTLVLDV